MAEPIAQLYKDGNRYALHYPEYQIWIRGAYAEWVLTAGAELIAKIEKLKVEGSIEELEMTREFSETGDVDIQVDALRYAANSRFEILPQCVVTMHDNDYRWVARSDTTVHGAMERLLDASLTRTNSYLSGSPVPRQSSAA